MTICASVKVAEGLVLAADSMVMLIGSMNTPQGPQQGVLQTFEYANKVTQVKDYPIGVMAWGIASIGDRTVQSLVMEFEHDYAGMADNAGYRVEAIAGDLISSMKERYDQIYSSQNKPELGLFIGGYSDREFFSEEFTYTLPSSTQLEAVRPPLPDGRPSFGSNWFGQVDALQRLIKGYAPAALAELVNRGADPDVLQRWVDDNVPELPIIFDAMPLQDAIDFAEYVVQVVIGRFRFGVGPPLCGGDIDIAVIRPQSFQWARRKQWAIKE